MFSQGEPVLAGVDLNSGFLFGRELHESRGGRDWASLFGQGRDQGLSLDLVVKDAALGIAAGVSELFPHAEQRDDCFHAHYAINEQLRRLETAAYGAITAEMDAERAIAKLCRTPGATREQCQGLNVKLGRARVRCRTRGCRSGSAARRGSRPTGWLHPPQ